MIVFFVQFFSHITLKVNAPIKIEAIAIILMVQPRVESSTACAARVIMCCIYVVLNCLKDNKAVQKHALQEKTLPKRGGFCYSARVFLFDRDNEQALTLLQHF